MADTDFEGATRLSGNGLVSTPAQLAGSATAFKLVHNFEATAAPSVSDDDADGFSIGSLWLRKDTGELWRCRDASTGAAKWVCLVGADYVAGNYCIPPRTSPASGTAPGANSLRLFPLVNIGKRVTVSELGARVTTAQASENFRCGIWAHNQSTGRPTGAVLAETGNISTTSTGNISGALGSNLSVEPGDGIRAWIGLVCSHATPAFASILPAAELFASTIGTATIANLLSSSTTLICGLSVPHTFGALPDLTSATFTEVSGTTIPLVFFRLASVP